MGVPEVNSLPDKVNSRKILYKTIQTASFTTPSPNNIANNFGSLSSWINVKAAMVSVADITEANNNISETENFT